MGVPSFVAWYYKRYKSKLTNVVLESLEKRIHTFYIDANCGFHPQLFATLKAYPDWKTNDEIEKKIFRRIIKYLDFLITYVNPTHRVYISVDGVAPLAKMNQQRKRRFASAQKQEEERILKKKFGVESTKNYSNVAITPGTVFMEKLNKCLEAWIKTKKGKLEWVLSSYHVPGEGEHKILADIKSTSKDAKSDINYAIYGLDADLVFLAMASGMKNIYLLREVTNMGPLGRKLKGDGYLEDPKDITQELNWFSMKDMCETFQKKINTRINEAVWKLNGIDINDEDKEKPKEIEYDGCITDFIVICFLLGNDFLPHFPSLNIKYGGMDIVLSAYENERAKYDGEKLVESTNPFKININLLQSILYQIGRKEETYFKYILPRELEKSKRWRPGSDDPYKVAVWMKGNLRSYDENGDVIYDFEYDPIELGEGDSSEWKYRYYEYYFGSSLYQDDLKDDLCEKYLEGIMWVGNYYFNSCPSWKWQYPYTHTVFVSDLANYVKKHPKKLNNMKFKLDKPFNPCSQLLAVLPPAYYHYLPKSYQSLVTRKDSPLCDYYPIHTEIDRVYQTTDWKCPSYIPAVNPKRIIKAVKDKKLTFKERVRNEIVDEPFVYKFK